MAEQKESSVLFSLKELMNLEEDRIKSEENEKKRQEDAAMQARLDAERRVREEEEARMRAADESRRQSEQRTREESARVEAIRHAEMEKARLDAENAARLEQLKQHQEHEHRIHALGQDEGKKKLKFIAIGAVVFLFLVMVGGGFAINSTLQKQKALEAQLNTMNDERDALNAKLKNATSPEERAALQAEIDVKNDAIEAAKKNPGTPAPAAKPAYHPPAGGGGAAPVKPAVKPPCDCKTGDPLCSCL
jgi:colicin import membrane protein